MDEMQRIMHFYWMYLGPIKLDWYFRMDELDEGKRLR